MSAALPRCQAHFVPDAGHFLFMGRWQQNLTEVTVWTRSLVRSSQILIAVLRDLVQGQLSLRKPFVLDQSRKRSPFRLSVCEAGPPIPPTRLTKAVEAFSRRCPSSLSTPGPICRA